MRFKFSYYTIIARPIPSVVIIYATRTAKTLAISSKYYAFIEEGNFGAIPSELFSNLIEIEAVVPLHEDELNAIVEINNSSIKDTNTLYQVIQPSANCQLGCGYCGQSHSKIEFSEGLDEALIGRIKHKLEHEKKFTDLQIAWFGGEPLMSLSSIRRLSAKFQNLAEEHNVSYSAKMVTNGMSLKPNIFLELVNIHNVYSFDVTLDGVSEFHDNRRFLKSGKKSFAIIFNNLIELFKIPNFKELGAMVSIRCNVDKSNYEGVIPLIKLMRAHDFHKFISGFYVAPIHSWGNDAHLMSLEKEEFSDKEVEWLMAQFENDFTPGLIPGRKTEVCLSVDPNAEVFDSFGQIFNCTEIPFVPIYEKSEYVLGHLNNVGLDEVFENRPLENWYDLIKNQDERFPCPKCKMFPVCAGACPKSWAEGIVACPSAKFNMQDRLALSYLIVEKGVNSLKV